MHRTEVYRSLSRQQTSFTMVYADYYFIEALYKLTGTGILLW
ncbi:MAG: hypothetical protein ACLUTY_10410 [Waltera sp.]